jgi:hypothetical protein
VLTKLDEEGGDIWNMFGINAADILNWQSSPVWEGAIAQSGVHLLAKLVLNLGSVEND